MFHFYTPPPLPEHLWFSVSENDSFSEVFGGYTEAATRVLTVTVVLKNFANFTGKRPCWSLFLIKSPSFRPATLLKTD